MDLDPQSNITFSFMELDKFRNNYEEKRLLEIGLEK
ncbi:MAG: hypothetical protein E6371_02975 [Terrisporobacter othiniensis]|uniref:Uncharacterized protein n=1 Tax=Terrisporobacter muris TaxID=2963284 RepID=A0A9X2MH07_9FIRM|nr:hypothetical protein [Terrisporobacter othiniensis]MCR1823956.1 hypothetical protein [Terrisporobacter muris]MDU6983353.1 hypothetical protein [Terrisporobacter othiniensis]